MYIGIITRTMLGRDSSVGTATRYGLNGPGIESQPIPVAERSKARLCFRSLAGIAVRIPPGAWMFVLCVVSKDQQSARQSRQRHKYG